MKESVRIDLSPDMPAPVVDGLNLPVNVNLDRPLLAPFVRDNNLVPPRLTVLFLSEFQDFMHRLNGSPVWGAFSTYGGILHSRDHVWGTDDSFQRVYEALQTEYGHTLERAILLPEVHRANYWSLVHEALHWVYMDLTDEQRAKLVQGLADHCTECQPLSDVLGLTHLNISHFGWPPDKLDEVYKVEGLRDRNAVNRLYCFENLSPEDRQQITDEWIANFYCNDRGRNRWDFNCSPESMRQAMVQVGYKLDDLPHPGRR